ncbi:ring-cleaving dioxygenase [Pseudomonas chlororaphis]|jgi:catechol 2,3-dioxygenase|uniref:VOC family protein n=1 Tax=Pseudomonas morbosilactucae TaxID=2938197 RepID=A0A9X2C8K8_9PSED|nr:VOC family protein [Pseudomonas morbosilactucae]MCK9800885.1 VOC family protein [Pseudomonas morbosilactucae]MCK9814924.1 VOC family protein [Pseudomonas morbosilactucae]ROL66143.1 ring-cleaving dioxygenase [Pseudomonas chlororaphis]WEK08093.1 MAG: VOC family protein [Pseudomonas sp.]
MNTLPRINFTHTGTFCADLDNMVEFYCSKLGFIVSDKGVASTGHRLFFMTQNPEVHHQLVLFDGKPVDLAFNPINQLSFLLDSLEDLQRYYQFAKANGIGPIDQVDHGNAWSLYFKDPEGNPIEMYVDAPYYTNQPCREPLDLEQSAEQIRAQTLAMCKRRPGFQTRDEWMQSISERIAQQRVRW